MTNFAQTVSRPRCASLHCLFLLLCLDAPTIRCHISVRIPSKNSSSIRQLGVLGFGAISELKPATVTKAATTLANVLLQGAAQKAKTVGVVFPSCGKCCPSPEGQKAALQLKQKIAQSFLETLLIELQPDVR